MNTIRYKTGYIHINFTLDMVRVQVDGYAYSIEVKSVHAAKILITKHVNLGRALK